MQYETSAGGVIAYSKKGQLLILLLKDKNGQWTFPKGLIEKGEDPQNTATREIEEEVGIKKLKLRATLTPIDYFYKWEGELVKKKVYYYMFLSDSQEKAKPQIEEGIMEVKWCTFDEALKIIGYKKTNVALLKEAKEKLK